MEAKELMIDDWVYEGNDHPIQVVRNYGRSIMYKEEYSNEVEETCLNPIPLTEKMLKDNGFVVEDGTAYKYRCGVYLLDVRCKIGEIDIYEEKGHWTSGYVCRSVKVSPFNYVHELQHALRLCGLTEQADNFKIR